MVAFLIGFGSGLLLSYVELLVLQVILDQDVLFSHLAAPITLVTTYLVLVTVLRNADRFRVVVPFVEFRNQRIEQGQVLLTLCPG